MKPAGQILYFRSRIDGKLQPYAVCATDSADTPHPLIVEVSPGATDLESSLQFVEEIAAMAAKNGQPCVALRSTGRGPGTVYQNYGEVDVMEAIEHAAGVYSIDRQRICVTGGSMGGAATWYLISHYPDFFAAAAPYWGYCDYRLWEKPGGLTFHMSEWEEPSWQSRSAPFIWENLARTPVWIIHGEWDRSVTGGVPVEHSRQMARLMEEKGFACKYTELEAVGHGCDRPALREEVILWMLSQRKESSPDRVALASYGLRHNRCYWVQIDQLLVYGGRGVVDAHTDGRTMVVTTDNVRALSLDPTDRGETTLHVDGQDVGPAPTSESISLVRAADGSWAQGGPPTSAEKRHGVSGPIGDLFFEGVVLVPGTTGTEAERFFNYWLAEHAQWHFSSRNGGVHRGSVMGENSVELPIVKDCDLSDAVLAERNLLLLGTPESNAVLKRFADKIPFAVDGKTLRLAGNTYEDERAAALAVFPHPENEARYVAVHGGVNYDAIAWGSNLDMMLLPDYIVYSGGDVLDWGFWNNRWRADE